MIDPMAIGVAAVTAALGKRAHSTAEWLLLHLVSLSSMTLVLALLLINIEADRDGSAVLDPAIAASHVLRVLGLPSQTWLDAFVAWLSRPELGGAVWAASAFAGVALLRWRRHGTEMAWIILILASTAVGPESLIVAIVALVVVVTVLCVPAFLETLTGPQNRDRGWFLPRFIVERGIAALVEFLLTPLIPLFRVGNGLTDRFTYDLDRRRARPTGAAAAKPE